MNEETDPYSPPHADPWPAVSDIQYANSGTLWRVVDGKLQVRHMASLPDIPVKGEAEGEAGRRLAMTLRVWPEWFYGIMWLLLAMLGFLAAWPEEMYLLLFFAAAFLPALLGKRVRVLMFRTNAEMRRALLRILLLVGLLIGFGFVAPLLKSPEILPWWKGDTLPVAALYFGVLHLIHHFRGGSLGWARGAGDGWVEPRGIAPAAIAKLEELQKRMPPSLAEPRPNRSA